MDEFRYAAALASITFSACSLMAQDVLPMEFKDWKQAGPGKFELKGDVAEAAGGMGLWWYGKKSYANATFHMKFKLSDTSWNSGVFVRFPNPGKDPWVAVRKGYEVQISGDKAGKQTTGAIYNIQAGTEIPLKKPGEWNDYTVTCVGRYIAVVLNGKLVNVYTTRAGRGDKEGYFGIQNHDPKSKVQFKDMRVQEWKSDATMMGTLKQLGVDYANWMTYRQKSQHAKTWYQQHDVSSVWANTFGDYYQGKERASALKGLIIETNPFTNVKALFNTETLKFDTVADSRYIWGGTPWTGSHGSLVKINNRFGNIFTIESGRGWADASGSFSDGRDMPGFGNFKDLQFNGYFRYGNQSVLDYSVLGRRILELPGGDMIGNTPYFMRQFQVSPGAKKNTTEVAQISGGKVVINGNLATIVADTVKTVVTAPKPDNNRVTVVKDKTVGIWADLSMGAPSKMDDADTSHKNKLFYRILPEFAQTHKKGGDEEGVGVRLNDGLAAKNKDDEAKSFFFEEGRKEGRIELRFNKRRAVERIHSYSWHMSERSSQMYTVYGAADVDAEADGNDKELNKKGWTKITSVNTISLGEGGKHGVAVVSAKGKNLGVFSKLLFICKPAKRRGSSHTFFSEIDVYFDKAPELKPLSFEKPSDSTIYASLKANSEGVKLVDLGDGKLGMELPASKKDILATLALVNMPNKEGDKSESVKALVPELTELTALTKGGPAKYLQEIEAKIIPGKAGDGGWITDSVELPIDNPWAPKLSFCGFDLFSDGDSAALSTWHGDVWIVSGLKSGKGKVKWRRFAAGLFQTLGLKIENDVVYVQGRDQITKLHDLNNDGEADWYECFNNGVIISKNFHEFAFGLDTDKEGNFYFAKGAPVRGGGRGFEQIVPHHGTVLKVPKSGKGIEVVASGLRAPGGVAVGPNGEITTGENEGTWQPCCKLNFVTDRGKFLGTVPTGQQFKDKPFHQPLCYFPMEVDNSGGGQVWVPKGGALGLKEGELLHLSYGKSSVYRVLTQKVGDQMQGGVVKLPVNLKSSAQTARFSSDRNLYVLGFRGWQTTASAHCAFHRVRRESEQPLSVPERLKVTDKGVYLTFSKELDANSVEDVYNFTIERWKYMRTRMYGSGKFSIDDPDLEAEKKAHDQESKKYRKIDTVKVTATTLLRDKRTVFIQIDQMVNAEQMQIVYKLKGLDGQPVSNRVVSTIHSMPPHEDLKILKESTMTEVAPKDLSDGLEQIVKVAGKEDRKVVSLPACYVAKGETASDMLKAGKFHSTWMAYLDIKKRVSPVFSLIGKGSAELKIDGVSIFKVSGDLSKVKSSKLQLDPGYHKFELIYKSDDKGSGQVRTLWNINGRFPETIPMTVFKHSSNASLKNALQSRKGRDHFAGMSCVQCHQGEEKKLWQLPELGNKGPSLANIGERVNEKWLAQWVASPHKLKAHAKMPQMLDPNTDEGKQQAADIAAYLSSLGKSKPKKKPVLKKMAKEGGEKFHSLGCAGCHTLPNGKSIDSSQISLTGVATKFSNETLSEFLMKPNKHHANIKMPDFKLKRGEADILSAFLLKGSEGKFDPAVDLKNFTGDLNRGKILVQSKNCASCHTGVPEGKHKLPSLNRVFASDWKTKGCLTKGKKDQPQYKVSNEQLEALSSYRSSVAEKLKKDKNVSLGLDAVSPQDFAARTYKTMNCVACHDKGERLSKLSSYHALSQPFSKQKAKVDQSRPHMTYIGEMLHTDYIQSVLDGSVNKPARPWLEMKMPAFAHDADLLAKGLSAQHGFAPSKPDKKPVKREIAKVGADIIGPTKGLSCVICHANGDKKAIAAFEVEGTNFDLVHKRLKKGFFHRWMDNPHSITPTSKMPRYMIDGVSPLSFYDKDAKKQFEAIREYFKQLEVEKK